MHNLEFPVPVQGTSHAILASSWPELKISQLGCDSSSEKREGSFPDSSDVVKLELPSV
jgi:hypothetical protein